MRKLLLAMVVAAGVLSMCPAQSGALTNDQLIEDVLLRSGAKRQIEGVWEVMEAQLAERQTDADPKVFVQVTEGLKEAYRADALYQAVLNHFRKNFDRDRMLAFQQWLQTPLSQKVTELEKHYSTPEGRQELVKFARKFRYLSKRPERLALIKRLDTATKASAAAEDISISTIASMMEAINAVLPPDKQADPEQLKKLPENLRARLGDSIQQAMLISYYQTYSTLSDAELEQYVQFYESELGRWASLRWIEALSNALNMAGQDAARKLAKSIAGMKRG